MGPRSDTPRNCVLIDLATWNRHHFNHVLREQQRQGRRGETPEGAGTEADQRPQAKPSHTDSSVPAAICRGYPGKSEEVPGELSGHGGGQRETQRAKPTLPAARQEPWHATTLEICRGRSRSMLRPGRLAATTGKRCRRYSGRWPTKTYKKLPLGRLGIIWASFAPPMFPYCSLGSRCRASVVFERREDRHKVQCGCRHP
jgi:hypothetical protein